MTPSAPTPISKVCAWGRWPRHSSAERHRRLAEARRTAIRLQTRRRYEAIANVILHGAVATLVRIAIAAAAGRVQRNWSPRLSWMLMNLVGLTVPEPRRRCGNSPRPDAGRRRRPGCRVAAEQTPRALFHPIKQCAQCYRRRRHLENAANAETATERSWSAESGRSEYSRTRSGKRLSNTSIGVARMVLAWAQTCELLPSLSARPPQPQPSSW